MPYSSTVFDKSVEKLINKIKPNLFFDVGPGAGKYGEMVKNNLPQTKTIGIEIEKDYIKKFKLNKIYDDVWNQSVVDLIRPKYYDREFGCVMLGDVLEHLRKSEGIDLVNFLLYRSHWIIIQFPHKYLQNSVEGYSSEAHISMWSENDFDGMECSKIFELGDQRLVVVKGYIDDGLSLNDLTKVLNNE